MKPSSIKPFSIIFYQQTNRQINHPTIQQKASLIKQNKKNTWHKESSDLFFYGSWQVSIRSTLTLQSLSSWASHAGHWRPGISSGEYNTSIYSFSCQFMTSDYGNFHLQIKFQMKFLSSQTQVLAHLAIRRSAALTRHMQQHIETSDDWSCHSTCGSMQPTQKFLVQHHFSCIPITQLQCFFRLHMMTLLYSIMFQRDRWNKIGKESLSHEL